MQSATRRFSPPESVGRAAQGFHRDVDLRIEIPEVLAVDLVLQGCHLVGGFLGIVHRHFVVAVEDGLLGGHAQHDVLADVQRGVQFGLLREIADLGALGGPGLAGEILVDAGHDPHQRGFTRAVDPDDTDLDAGQEAQADVLETLLASGIGLGDTVHVIDVLIGGHG